MKDGFGREINYIRISLTDRCNLRCVYCMPDGVRLVPREEILREDEIALIVRALAQLGICHVKITGGEPLVRSCCRGLIRQIRGIDGIQTVTLTTNGILLPERIDWLKESGIDGVNISLDTTDPKRYAQITGGGDVSKAIDAVHACVKAGIRTKINAVTMRTDNEDLLAFAKDEPVDVRFIEMMPIGYGKQFRPVDNRKVLEEIMRVHPGTEPDLSLHGPGPAVYYRIPGYQGSAGFISAIHGKFCGSCNRIRLTSMGFLKTCLCYDEGTDLREIVRDPKLSDADRCGKIREAAGAAILHKPAAHCFDEPGEITERHLMASIGG